MTRVKKTYCMVSLIVAMVVLVLTLSWSAGGTTVYAASMDPDSITTFDGDNSEGGVTRAAEDSTNGLTISYNNDGVSSFSFYLSSHGNDRRRTACSGSHRPGQIKHIRLFCGYFRVVKNIRTFDI